MPPSPTEPLDARRPGPAHYLRRFLDSWSQRAPIPADEAWIRSLCTPAEYALYARLSNQDRRHLAETTRAVEQELGPGTDPVWLRASVLHDVGKHAADLGVIGRSIATVVAVVGGRTRVAGWADRRGWRGRIGRYERHGEIGADELRAAGSPDAVAEWSALHHHPERFRSSTIPAEVLAVLIAADR